MTLKHSPAAYKVSCLPLLPGCVDNKDRIPGMCLSNKVLELAEKTIEQ